MDYDYYPKNVLLLVQISRYPKVSWKVLKRQKPWRRFAEVLAFQEREIMKIQLLDDTDAPRHRVPLPLRHRTPVPGGARRRPDVSAARTIIRQDTEKGDEDCAR